MYQRQGQRYASDVADAEGALMIEPKGKPRKTPGRQAGAIESDATLGTTSELTVNADGQGGRVLANHIDPIASARRETILWLASSPSYS
jgi:hypothetical protein